MQSVESFRSTQLQDLENEINLWLMGKEATLNVTAMALTWDGPTSGGYAALVCYEKGKAQ